MVQVGETENARAKAGKCKQGQVGRGGVGGLGRERLEARGVLQGTGPAAAAELGLWGKRAWRPLSRRVQGELHFRKISLSDMFVYFFLSEREDGKMLMK